MGDERSKDLKFCQHFMKDSNLLVTINIEQYNRIVPDLFLSSLTHAGIIALPNPERTMVVTVLEYHSCNYRETHYDFHIHTMM